MAEAASLSPLFAGVSYARLEGWGSLQWPVAADGTDTPRLYSDGRFHFDDGKARLVALEWQDALERTDDEYDLHLNNGRLLEHFHEGNMTARGVINTQLPEGFVEVPADLANARGLKTGGRVRLISRCGRLEVAALVSQRPRGNNLFMHVHTRTPALNLLTGDHADDAVDTPAFKELAVSMEVITTSGESSLPLSHPRFGHRQPSTGVQVEEKWRRANYAQPPETVTNPEKF